MEDLQMPSEDGIWDKENTVVSLENEKKFDESFRLTNPPLQNDLVTLERPMNVPEEFENDYQELENEDVAERNELLNYDEKYQRFLSKMLDMFVNQRKQGKLSEETRNILSSHEQNSGQKYDYGKIDLRLSTCHQLVTGQLFSDEAAQKEALAKVLKDFEEFCETQWKLMPQDEQMRFEYDSEEEVKMTKKPRKQRDPDFSLYKKKNYPELLKNFPKKSTKLSAKEKKELNDTLRKQYLAELQEQAKEKKTTEQIGSEKPQRLQEQEPQIGE